jgi:hypothetical protein
MNNFIEEYNIADKNLCDDLIDFFNKSENKKNKVILR